MSMRLDGHLQVRPVVGLHGRSEVPFRQLLACIVRDAYFDKESRVREVRAHCVTVLVACRVSTRTV